MSFFRASKTILKLFELNNKKKLPVLTKGLVIYSF